MGSERVAERVVDLVMATMGLTERPAMTARMWDDLGCDSLDAIEVVVALEEEFDIDIVDEEIQKWNLATTFTVGDLVKYMEAIVHA